MLTDTIEQGANEAIECRQADYRAPEVHQIGSAKQLIQGNMIREYYDCLGSGMTLTRPNC
jgi:hypothetical protein